MLDVDHSVPFVGERSQGLGEQRQGGDPDAELAFLGRDDHPAGPDPVAQIEIGECGHGGRIEGRRLGQQLNPPGVVTNGGEGELAK